MIKKSAIAVALIACAVMALATATPAAASATATPASMQQRINAVLATEPGGVQTAWNEVSWDDGAIILTLADETGSAAEASQVGTCASGTFCVYSLQNYLGNKLTFSICTSNLSVSGLNAPVRSIANSRSSGSVMAYNNGTYVTTVAAGTGKNILVSITSLSCA